MSDDQSPVTDDDPPFRKQGVIDADVRQAVWEHYGPCAVVVGRIAIPGRVFGKSVMILVEGEEESHWEEIARARTRRGLIDRIHKESWTLPGGITDETDRDEAGPCDPGSG